MKNKELACCVVRDLLPSYMEGLTEAETAAMVKEHMDNCPACRRVEEDMRHTVPVTRTPRHELRFLRRVRRTRLIAAVLSAVVALWCMWWLYGQAFCYPNTDAGRLEAVEDYIPLPEDSSSAHGVKAGTPLQVGGWEIRDRHLFIFYLADNEEHVHGIVHLVRGLNGKYRILEANEAPSCYAGGIYGGSLTPAGTDWKLFYLAGVQCRDIYRAEVEFTGLGGTGTSSYSATSSLALSGESFLQLWEQEALTQELGLPEAELTGLYVKHVTLFDKDGEDITGAYFDETLTDVSWGSGKATAETFLLYVYMGIVALLGVVFVRYFLRRD